MVKFLIKFTNKNREMARPLLFSRLNEKTISSTHLLGCVCVFKYIQLIEQIT